MADSLTVAVRQTKKMADSLTVAVRKLKDFLTGRQLKKRRADLVARPDLMMMRPLRELATELP
jgi:hypothetical protein